MATEKRLIDAIALISKARRMETTDNNGYPMDTFAVPVMVIEDATTVDAVEVVHGRWEEHDRSGIKIKGFMVCSVCNVMIPTADDNHYCLPRLNYCPNCGARMMDGDGNG